MKRRGFTRPQIHALRGAFRLLFRADDPRRVALLGPHDAADVVHAAEAVVGFCEDGLLLDRQLAPLRLRRCDNSRRGRDLGPAGSCEKADKDYCEAELFSHAAKPLSV